MTKQIKTTAATVLVLVAMALGAYNFRAFLPFPGTYVEQLQYLKGWSANGFYAFNCSGFISRAHGEEFMTEREMYRDGAGGKLAIITEFASREAVDESVLQPGDVAAFAGPDGVGLHVAAFIRPGLWIDGDSRRGNVDTYRLQDKSTSDIWFVGKVRILRWTTPAKHFVGIGYFAREQAAMLARTE